MTDLMRTGDAASVQALLPYLRSQDAALRAAAVEALQALPGVIPPFLDQLLRDADSDVRIMATELVLNMPATAATHVLCAVLERDQHPNVCGAAIELLAEVGTPAAVPVLRSCAERFAGIPFMTFAVSTAIARISDTHGQV
jgi:HEAT repeat protein